MGLGIMKSNSKKMPMINLNHIDRMTIKARKKQFSINLYTIIYVYIYISILKKL